ncbi:hypothetical protein FB45DRAFT_1138420 [Roridomyces roridus]|uniref:Uncharacterized protein n=1 Tax=Roridomyces roridus TaxID=1738132 RepID=A0AAD7C1I8_9AGAR|nr:hypothetical protein FB45DRAFT_1138420 [Roridomyces roridus]
MENQNQNQGGILRVSSGSARNSNASRRVSFHTNSRPSKPCVSRLEFEVEWSIFKHPKRAGATKSRSSQYQNHDASPLPRFGIASLFSTTSKRVHARMQNLTRNIIQPKPQPYIALDLSRPRKLRKPKHRRVAAARPQARLPTLRRKPKFQAGVRPATVVRFGCLFLLTDSNASMGRRNIGGRGKGQPAESAEDAELESNFNIKTVDCDLKQLANRPTAQSTSSRTPRLDTFVRHT